ncbi:glycosyl transferase family 1 [Bacteroidia bacterium]|nr:glycosyl transferase family 1 [Bacteroidia bacterium]
MQNKRIAIVVNEDLFFLTHRKNLGLALMRDGWSVYILATKTKEDYVKEIESLGFKFQHIPFERAGMSLKGEYKTFSAICKAYKVIRPTLVLTVGLKGILWGGIAVRRYGIPLVSAVSGLGFLFTEGRKSVKQIILINLLKYFLPPKRHHIVFQNNEDKDIFIKNHVISENQTSIIRGMGVDLNEFAQMPFTEKKGTRFLFPARMLKDKGVIEFIEAAKKVGKDYPNAEFILAGSIDTKNPTGIPEAVFSEMIKNTSILWIGFQTQMIPIYRDADVVVLPSYREGFPKVLIEACAIGRPVITTDAPGCKDCVIDGYNGFVVPVKNIEKLADAMLNFLGDTDLIPSMGYAAAQFAREKFDSSEINRQFIHILTKI